MNSRDINILLQYNESGQRHLLISDMINKNFLY